MTEHVLPDGPAAVATGRRRRLRPAIAAALACAMSMVAPAIAHAGTYPVYVCGAPGQNHALSFSENTNHISQAQWCGGSGIQVWSSSSVSGGQAGGWWFHAPAGTTITQLSSDFKMSAFDGWVSHWATSEGGGGDPYPAGSDCETTFCDATTNGFDWSTGVANATELGFAIWCHASTCQANDPSQSWFGPAASANVYDATIVIDDPGPPTLAGDEGTLTRRPAWVSAADAPAGGWTLTTDASDPGGVCGLEISVGSEQDQANVGADYTQPAPCGVASRWSPTFTLNPCALPDGSYVLSESASNPAGMVGYGPYNGESINIDCTPPSTAVASAPSSSRWYASAQRVTFSGSDNFSGVGRLDCNDGDHAGSAYTETVSAQGTDTVSCEAVDNAANVGRSASATVHLDYQSPTVSFSGPSQSGWLSGAQTLTATGAESQSLSGIASVACSVDGDAPTTTQGSSQTIRVTSDGTHIISCRATSGAGVTGAAASYTVHVDSEPPTISFSGGPPQGKWLTSAQSITVTAQDQPDLSGVSQIACTLDGNASTYAGSHAQITVPPPGGELTCKAQDNAGNWSASQAWDFLIDDTPPSGSFAATDPSNPARVAVQLADAGSGVAGARIEIQTASGWQSLPTSWDAGTGVATATVPDDGSLPDGTYELEAIAWDVAGNQATITRAAGGGPETVTLPIRIATDVKVATATVLRRHCSERRIVVQRRPRHGPHRAAATRLKRSCSLVPVPVPHGAIAARLAYGQRQVVHGLLTTLDGSPITRAPVAVTASVPGWPARRLGTVTTDSQGRFTYTLSGASETVTFSYGGTATLRYSAGQTVLRVLGKARLRVAGRATAGHALRVSGRVYGGFIPSGGVLVQLQYRVRGVPVGWAPFHALIHTDPQGRFTTRFPVSAGARGYMYLLRAVIDQQSGWPFLTTTSNVVARDVR